MIAVDAESEECIDFDRPVTDRAEVAFPDFAE